jgi:hypothetical protein
VVVRSSINVAKGGIMFSIDFSNPWAYIGFFLIAGGLYFILAGLEIAKYQPLIVKPGRLTCIIGVAAAIVGVLILQRTGSTSPQVAAPISTPTGSSSPTRASTTATAETSPSEVLLCKDTGNLMGTMVTCTLDPAYCSYEASTNGSPTFCNDAPFPDNIFTMVVWGEDWTDYDGQCLVITGRVTAFHAKPQIEARDRSQISLCP